MNPTDARVTSTIQDRIATVLMLVSALGALYAFFTAIGAVQTATPATQQVETWRLFGFLMFAGVFILLGVWPRRLPGLWELTIANKVGLTVVEVLLTRNDEAGAQSAAVADAILCALLIVAYLLSRGYTAWRPLPRPYTP
ncbi:MAG TPA: hypothetical protein VFW17_07925 [Ktedonobacterales bacterium]|nr:hypothetical protein [Ktedonobacterales bacterium]